jgi:hypothetical protein
MVLAIDAPREAGSGAVESVGSMTERGRVGV